MIIQNLPSIFNCISQLSAGDLVEGAFYSVWFGHGVFDWTKCVGQQQSSNHQPLSVAEKTRRFCEFSKHIFLKSCSLLSGLSKVVCWSSKVSLIIIGSTVSYISAGGYLASALVLAAKMWDALEDFSKDLLLYTKGGGLGGRGEIFFRQVQNVIKLSFFICMATWAALSGAHVLLGGEALMRAVNICFYCGVTLFCGNCAILSTHPRVEHKKDS